ncbi:MAG: relaxase [Streptosporangiales bacterium]|nr:relaxase [Streptosporangiales bacterium]
MIGKVLRGTRVGGLIYYLYGPGKYQEHTDPHLIAGWRDPDELEPPLRDDGRRDFRLLTGLLRQPLAVLGERNYNRPVWHCVARAAPDDRMLSDAEWAHVARAILHHTGLAPVGEEDEAVRWVAIRHATDHIHIVATLARQDGRRPRIWNDFYRVREACRMMEERHRLRPTAPGDRTAAKRPTRTEAEKAHRRDRTETPRVTLRRHVSAAAAGARTEDEFFARLHAAEVLVRKRLSTTNPGQVTGYAVALPDDTTRTGTPVWYGGGKLAADLTLPKLRARWPTSHPADHHARDRRAITPEEQRAIWDHAIRTAAHAAAHIRALAATDPTAAADAAWAASDTLHAAAAALGSRMLREAADAYDRAARAPYGRIPRPTPTGNSLRTAARLLSALGYVTQERTIAQMALVANLAALAAAVADLRRAQQHAAQADAARQAAEQLHVPPAAPGPPPHDAHNPVPGLAGNAADLARLDFPNPPHPGRQARKPGPPRPTRPGPRPRRGPDPPRPRGPTR